MQEAGVNLVSLGIFSWSRLEPEAGKYDFDWLDRIMDMLHDGGISVDLATATASPPPWMSHRYPEMLPGAGRRRAPVARRAAALLPQQPGLPDSAPSAWYEQLADRYAQHPALAMWHVGNEFGCHVPACYCDVSAEAFRAVAARALRIGRGPEPRVGDRLLVAALLRLGRGACRRAARPTWPNPSQQLDFMRFSSDELLACYESRASGAHGEDARTCRSPPTSCASSSRSTTGSGPSARTSSAMTCTRTRPTQRPAMRVGDGGRPDALARAAGGRGC